MIETFWMGSVTVPPSDAAAGLGDPGDLGGHLRRALREQMVELLDGNARGLAEHAHGGPGALLVGLLALEPVHLPVPVRERVDALSAGELDGHVLRPLSR